MSEADEWAVEMGDEAEGSAGCLLPLIVGRSELATMLDCPHVPAMGRLAMRTLYATGVRPGELFQVKRQADGLSVAGRAVAVDSRTWRQLEATPLVGDAAELAGWVSAAAGHAGLLARFAGCSRRLLPGLFRHAFAVHCLEGGMDLMALFQQMGHLYLDTTMKYLACASGYCRPAYTRYHPLMQLREPAREGHAPLSVPEVMALLGAPDNLLHQLVVRLLYATALRESELIQLRYTDLEWAEERVFVRAGKGPQDRYTLIDPDSLRLLKKLQGATSPDERIFAMSRMTVYNVVTRAARKTGLLEKFHAQGKKVSPHTLRHAYATHCYERGMDLPTIARLLGHPFMSDTLLYVHCTPESLAGDYLASQGAE